MRTQFIADDGTAFDTASECRQYERENALSDYEKELLEKLGNVEKQEKKSPWERFKSLFQ